ncbi:MAG: DUF2062 domain-containing protein [Sphingomonadaceae bacterium]
MPTRAELMENRFLRPFAVHLASPLIWRLNRRGVARGMALGLFAGFAMPVAQTPFAAMLAVFARANLPVAAVATLVTNPLTVPFIYYLAFRTGTTILRTDVGQFAIADDTGLLRQILSWFLTMAGPTWLGLLLFAAVSAALGYVTVHLAWRMRALGRRKRRTARRSGITPARIAADRL